MWPRVYVMSSVICACLVFLSVGDLLVNSQADHQQTTPDTQMTYTCGHILRNNTNSTNIISGRNSNGTKHSGGPPEDGCEKKTETCRGFILTKTFLIFYWF
jgi:hypothetical protein